MRRVSIAFATPFSNKRADLEDLLQFESWHHLFGTVQLFDIKNHVSFFLISCPSQIEKKSHITEHFLTAGFFAK